MRVLHYPASPERSRKGRPGATVWKGSSGVKAASQQVGAFVIQLLCAAYGCSKQMLNNALVMQLSTTEGNSYYVGTKMDAFVYDTLNAWYQEDMNTVSCPAISP